MDKVDRWKDGWMDKWAERWMNGRMDITDNYGLVWLHLVSSG